MKPKRPAAPFLFGASALSNGDFWAVGTDFLANRTKAILIHGNTWTETPTPSPGREAYGNILSAVDALGPAAVWAAGSADSPVILRWNGARWTSVYGGPWLSG